MTDEKPDSPVGDAAKGGRARRDALTPEERKEIASKAAQARWGSAPITSNSLPGSRLTTAIVRQAIAQPSLFVDKEKEIDGVGMGVLSDGTAFLTGRGLGRLCGVSNARIVELGQNWDVKSTNAMSEGVKNILREKGCLPPQPYIEIMQRSGAFYAYPDYVCLAVLEYYAFDQPTDNAKKNFRLLAGVAMRDFIYVQVGYDPRNHVPEKWRQFHDRVSLTYNSVPAGYFSVFKEIADIVVHLGQMGLTIDSTFVPDISVGMHWGKHWEEQCLAQKYGERVKFEHNYPGYFPQAKSNPQHPWCYPEMALGEFKRWIRETYVKAGKFKKYLDDQVTKKALPPSFAQIAVSVYSEATKAVEDGSGRGS